MKISNGDYEWGIWRVFCMGILNRDYEWGILNEKFQTGFFTIPI